MKHISGNINELDKPWVARTKQKIQQLLKGNYVIDGKEVNEY